MGQGEGLAPLPCCSYGGPAACLLDLPLGFGWPDSAELGAGERQGKGQGGLQHALGCCCLLGGLRYCPRRPGVPCSRAQACMKGVRGCRERGCGMGPGPPDCRGGRSRGPHLLMCMGRDVICGVRNWQDPFPPLGCLLLPPHALPATPSPGLTDSRRGTLQDGATSPSRLGDMALRHVAGAAC